MIRKIGKKGREWIRERARLIKEAVLSGRIQIINGEVWGRCEICGKWKHLDPHHKVARSQGGEHSKKNIIWICRLCHRLITDKMSKKDSTKKADWMKPHKCKSCKFVGSQYICANCGEKSI